MDNICKICNSINTEIILKGIWDSDNRDVYRCKECSTVFLYPMMDTNELKEFYSKEGIFARLKRLPDKDGKEFLENKQLNNAERQVEQVKDFLKEFFLLCEVGASNGHFLNLTRQYVKDVLAVEPGLKEQSILKEKNIKYFSEFKDIPEDFLKFDAIAMFHVFEHLPDPIKYLNNLSKHLKEGGLVFVEVPNIDDALVSRYNNEAFKKFYFQSMHCFYYNEKTLSNIFFKANFELVDCKYIQRYDFANHLQWLLHGKSGGNEYYKKIFKSINIDYSDIMKKEKITDTIMCVFKRAF